MFYVEDRRRSFTLHLFIGIEILETFKPYKICRVACPYPLPERDLQTVQSSDSSFTSKYLLFSLRSLLFFSMYNCVVLCIVCFVLFCVLFFCKRVLYYCHRVTTKLQLQIYGLRYKSVNTPVRHTSVNTPVRHTSVNTPSSHERLVVSTWLAVYSGWG